MVDQSLVTSGFDAEVLLSQRYLRYVLLAQIEAGLLPLELQFALPSDDPEAPADVNVTIHPPSDYKRLYDEHPDIELPVSESGSFDVDPLFDHATGANLRVALDVTLKGSGIDTLKSTIHLFLRLGLEFEPAEHGLQKNHELTVEVVEVGGPLVALVQLEGADPDTILQEVKAVVDRTIPFGVVGGRVQVVELRFHPLADGKPAALGIYVNLALKDGPEEGSFAVARGNVADAQNFLPDDHDLAFATSPGLYALLGPDARFRRAERTEDGFHFPLRKDPNDPCSDPVGKIKGITVRAEVAPQGGVPTGRLEIDLHGEYTEAPFNPDFHFKLRLRPEIENGLLDWDIDTSLDLGLAGLLLVTLASAVLGVLTFSPGIGLGAFFTLLAVKSIIVEPAIAAGIARDSDFESDLSFFDVLPHRIAAARRRWDPLYATDHEVVALLDDVQINFEGIAFSGVVKLGKSPAPKRDAILRDEQRDVDGSVTHLRYLVDDFAEHEPDFTAIAPGTDRRAFSRADPAGEPTLVSLTDAQIAERLEPDRPGGPARLVGPIALVPKRAHVHQGQIDDILCITRRESNAEEALLIDAFRAEKMAEIEAGQGEQIRDEVAAQLEDELGQPPTEEEVDARVAHRIAKLVEDALCTFKKDELPGLLDEALAKVLRFDLAPEELAPRQHAGVLLIEGKEIIVREGKPYYRDHPDAIAEDNLLVLPRYQPPYEPEA